MIRSVRQGANADIPASWACIGGALLGLVFILHLLPLPFIVGHSAYFELGDRATSVSGLQLYLEDEWRFPLLVTKRINPPAGISIAYTDSIPLLALAAKLARAIVGTDLHYLGYWMVACYVAQGASAALFIRACGLRTAADAFLAAIFALLMPTLMQRMLHHPSLLAWGFFIGAGAVYITAVRGEMSSLSASIWLLILAFAALLTNPYLYAMTAPIAIAFWVDKSVKEHSARSLWPAMMLLLATPAVLWLLGYQSEPCKDCGYNLYSMNVLAPFCGGSIFRCSPGSADGTGGQDYDYLGLGALLLLGSAMLFHQEKLRNASLRMPALVVCLVLFAIYAMSNKVYVGKLELVAYPLPAAFDFVTGTFRSAGRFFWPVSALLGLAALALWLKVRSLAGYSLVIVAVVVQWIDIGHLRDGMRTTASAAPSKDIAAWAPATQGVRHILVFPKFGCMPAGQAEIDQYTFFSRLAAATHTTINSVYTARRVTNCNDVETDVGVSITADQMVVLLPSLLEKPGTQGTALRQLQEGNSCARSPFGLVCRQSGNDHWWRATVQAGLEPLSQN